MNITPEERRMKLRKLAKLANFLDDLPSDRFHMPTWASKDATATTCGTAGCAAGWAATVFNKDGFALSRDPRRPVLIEDGRIVATEVRAFALFFGITFADAEDITTNIDDCNDMYDEERPNYCQEYGLDYASEITPRHAAERIRKVLLRYSEVDAEALDITDKPEGASAFLTS